MTNKCGRDRVLEAIRQALKNSDKSMDQCAKSCGMSAPNWSNILHGRRAASPKLLEKMAKAVGLNIRVKVEVVETWIIEP